MRISDWSSDVCSSDLLPGDVIGTVTEPVYDTATGKFLLIPQGSRILGRYNSQVSYGQSRVQVVWNRIILPDTSSLTLDNLVGTDPAGYAGLEDDEIGRASCRERVCQYV